MLWENVIFDGGHCGDHLSLPEVLRLRRELAELRKVDFKKLKLSESDLDYVEEFQADLASVVKVANQAQEANSILTAGVPRPLPFRMLKTSGSSRAEPQPANHNIPLSAERVGRGNVRLVRVSPQRMLPPLSSTRACPCRSTYSRLKPAG